jgi:hypothetical protein
MSSDRILKNLSEVGYLHEIWIQGRELCETKIFYFNERQI